MLNKNYKSNTYSFYFILFTGLLKDILGEKQSYYILKMPGEVKVMIKALANTKGS